jgi:amidophosphoribosyltransferase
VEFKGKNVLLVDDSIVRGTTSYEIVQMAREAGANKVFMASAAAPVKFPNVYGIDMPTRSELIANGRDSEEIRKMIGADALVYQTIDGMKKAVGLGNSKIRDFEASCFDGKYIAGGIDAEYLDRMEANRKAEASRDEDPRNQMNLSFSAAADR